MQGLHTFTQYLTYSPNNNKECIHAGPSIYSTSHTPNGSYSYENANMQGHPFTLYLVLLCDCIHAWPSIYSTSHTPNESYSYENANKQGHPFTLYLILQTILPSTLNNS